MFKKLQEQVQANFKKLQQSGPVFIIDVDKEEIWQKYLDGFKESDRQSNVCRCCQSFMRQFAGIVGITDKFEVKTIWDGISWDFEGAGEYKNSVESINKWIKSHPVSDVFLHSEKHCGNNKSFDPKKDLTWYHYHLELPTNLVNKGGVDTVKGDKRANKEVLKRSLDELTIDATETTLELIAQNSLYRGNEHKATLVAFLAVQKEYKELKNNKSKDNFCWVKSSSLSPAVSRIKNTSIGTLLVNISEGMELDKAVAAFERVVAPQNYKRPTAIITPRMIEEAKGRLEELNLIGALNRKVLSEKDLDINNIIWKQRVNKGVDIFTQLKEEVVINPKSLTKVEEVSLKDFVEKVLSTAKSIRVLLENRHLGNFVTLAGPQEESEKQLLKWKNGISWDYIGGLSDSIVERVKAAGGQTNAILRASLAWANTDDLDISIKEPNGYVIYYGNKRKLSPGLGQLDVDANGGDGMVPNPVENIYWANYPSKEGDYEITINNFRRRETQNDDWELEVAYRNDEVYHFNGKNGPTGRQTKIPFNYSRKNGITFPNRESQNGYPSQTRWGLKTGIFHKVKSISNSPNYWGETPTGNKHLFLFLEGCRYEEKPRAFLNEYLDESLSKERKVFELLGGKIEIQESSDPLCGIGFSETIRNSIFVEIEGTFKRVVKLNF